MLKSKILIQLDMCYYPYMDRKLSKNFKLSEFDFVPPDLRLIAILQKVRNETGKPVKITNAARDIKEHVKIYKDLEKRKKIKTKGNGLGDNDLIDIIPWGSRHLPNFKNPYLRACDIQCRHLDGNYSGDEIYQIVSEYVDGGNYLSDISLMQYGKDDVYVGLGIGKDFLHIDVDRNTNTVWKYDY
jgi:hypothetical protein